MIIEFSFYRTFRDNIFKAPINLNGIINSFILNSFHPNNIFWQQITSTRWSKNILHWLHLYQWSDEKDMSRQIVQWDSHVWSYIIILLSLVSPAKWHSSSLVRRPESFSTDHGLPVIRTAKGMLKWPLRKSWEFPWVTWAHNNALQFTHNPLQKTYF